MQLEIKNLRETVRISQLELSHISGVSRYRLNLAERGRAELTAEEVARIKAVLLKGVNCKTCGKSVDV